MSRYIIYKSDGTERAKVASLEYQGDWMNSRYVQVDVKSPVELQFEVGDYLLYRGERFELKNATAIKKQANSGMYGEAFTYSSIKFESYLDELVATACINYTFTDESSTTVGGSLLSEFSLHCETVQDLVNLVAANMKRAYEQGIITGEWEFKVAEGGETDVTIDISNINCLEALKKVYDEFGLGFKIDKASRSVYVGYADDNYNEFLFGKGKGLRDIEKQVNTDYDLITRLRVVGNTTNMPRHYYYYLQIKPYGFTVKGALIYSKSGSTSTSKAYQTYRISEAGSFFFNLPYGVKINTESTLPISINGKSCTAKYWGTADDYKLTTIDSEVQELINTTFEKIEAGGTPDAGIFSFEIDDAYISSCPNGKKTWKASGKADLLPLANLMPTTYDVYNSTTGKLDTKATYGTDGSNFVLDPYFDSVNVAKYGIREAYVEFTSDDDEKGIEDIYPTIENETNTVKVGSTITDDGIFDNGENVSGFKITINDIGFNLNNTRPDGQSSYGTLCMKTGLLGGREFEITSVTYNTIDGTQVLTCKRIEDDDTDTYMPNKYWQIEEGDEFVITDIEMPDSYVEGAGDYLAEQAREYLSRYDHPHYNYNVSIDNIYLARDNDSNGENSIYHNIKEGDYLKIQDEDLIGVDDNDKLLTEKISIDKLTIKEQEGKIPQVSVTLRNEKKENTITRITRTTAAISSSTSSAVSSVKKSIRKINSEIDSESEDSVIPSSGSTTNVTYTATQTDGNEIGVLTINDVASTLFAPDHVSEADHADEADHAEEADVADIANGLSDELNSALESKYLRKDKADTTKYGLTANGLTSTGGLSVEDDTILHGTEINGDLDVTDSVNTDLLDVASQAVFEGTAASDDFRAGILTGQGWRIDDDGNGELESLILRSFLEVPELRYNRVTVESGVTWNAAGAGVVKEVDYANKKITLKLEDGEIGSFEVGDICLGVWNFKGTSYSSIVDTDSPDYDDAKASGLTCDGFMRVYFLVTAVSGTYNQTLTYSLRSDVGILAEGDDSWNIVVPPMPQMTIVAYGNTTEGDRQKSFYSTKSFSRYLADVNQWKILPDHIKMQLGDCSGLVVGGVDMSGYSAYLNNIYFDGKIKQLEDLGGQVNYCGEYDPDTTYKKNDEVLYDDALWIYNGADPTTGVAPTIATWSQVPLGSAMTIKSTTVEYAISSSGTTQPTTWNYTSYATAMANASQGKYIWSHTKVVYSDNSQTDTYGCNYISKDGSITTQDVSVSSIQTIYRLVNGNRPPRAYNGESLVTDATEGWSATKPQWTNGYYLYREYIYTFSDGTTKVTSVESVDQAKIRVRGVYSSSETYYNDSQFFDVVIYNGSYYTPKVSSTKGQIPSDSSSYWEAFNQFENIATSVLLANQGYIDVLDSGQIFVGNTDKSSGWKMTDGAITHTVSGFSLTADGNLVNGTNGKITFSNQEEETTFEVDKYGDVSVYGAINTQAKNITSSTYSRYMKAKASYNYCLDLLHLPDVIVLDESLSGEGSIFEDGGSITLPCRGRYNDSGTERDFNTTDDYIPDTSTLRKLIGRKVMLYNTSGQTINIKFYGIASSDGTIVETQDLELDTDHIGILECMLKHEDWVTANNMETIYWHAYAGGQIWED